MKKYLVTLTLLCLALLPINAYAIALEDNGDTIKGETKDGEYTILVAPDTDTQNSNSGFGVITPNGKNDESDLPNNGEDGNIDSSNKDDIYITTAQENAESLANSKGKKNDNILIIIISTILGLMVGSIGTYIFMKKRK